MEDAKGTNIFFAGAFPRRFGFLECGDVQLYKTSGLQNVRFTKRQVFKTSGCKKTSIHIFFTCCWWKSAGSVAAMFAGKVMAVIYSLF
jgi:hypothetical protein